MGPFDNYEENLVDTVTVVDENLVDRLEDTVSDGGCVSGVADDNAGVALRKDLLCSERRVDCLSGNSCWNYRCSDDMDRTNKYHPPFRNYPVGDGVGFTDSKSYEEMHGNGEVNGLSYGAVGEMEKGEFGASSLCLNDSDIRNCFISDVGLDNPSPGGETLTTSSPGSSGVTCILLYEQKETVLTGLDSQTYMTDCLDDRFLASSQEDDEERGRDSTGVSPDLPTGRNLDGSRQGSPEISFQNPVEGSVAPLPLLFGATGIGCSKYLSISDKCERFGVSALTCCSSTVDGYTELMSNDGRNDFKHGTLFESNNAEIGPSSSSMISRGRKSKLLTRTGRAAKQCRQTVISSSCLSNNLGTTSNVKRGKRSIFCKPARLNTWGELGSLVQMFDQNASISRFNLRSSCHEAGLLGSESKLIKNQGSVKKKGSFGRGRCEKGGKSECFKGSKRSASTIRRRSKVKLEGWGARKGRRSLKVDPLAGQALKPLDAGSLCSLAENPNCADTGSNSNPKIGCIHTAIDGWVHETNCLLNSEITQPDREAVHKLEAEWFGDGRRDQLVLSEPAGKFRLPLDVNSGRPIMSPDVSVLDPQHVDKDMESTVTVDKLTEYALGDFQGVSPQIEIEISKEAIVNMHSEPGLFPALEGFNPIPEKGAIISEIAISKGQKSKAKKGRKNGKVKGDPYLLAGPFPMEHNLLNPGSLNKARKLTKNRAVKSGRSRNGPKAVSRCSSLKASGSKGFSMEISVPDIAEVMVSRENVKLETATENLALSVQNTIGIEQSGAPMSEGSLPIGKSKGHKLSKKSRIAARKNRSLDRDSAKSRKVSARGKKKEIKDNAQNYLMLQDAGGFNDGEEVACGDTSGAFMVAVGDDLAADNSSKGLEVQCLPPRAAWVLCDDCQKWRCIPAELADVIEETNCKWTCKDNTDKAYADCLIPQEKSNAEINAELNISDEDSPSAQPYFKGSETMQSTASQQASWTLIKSNLFLHRSRRTQTIDEIMVCQCKPPQDGHMGCGDECLNRMLNIECVQGTCPCGDLCSNQQFQRRKYANFKWFRCGKKGYGLQLRENVSQGAFLIEYVGEVLDLHAYEARQQQYASRGQKHFYFMTLNGNEVIDACAKGNLGRFINHSCDPNCRTEKWMVNGQVCIGLFALRDIKKGEEVTFDYNYVRVFGAAAKKCVCGSSGCRGYIGGDPSNTEVIKVDSDDEYPEPIMIHEDGRIERFEEEEILDSRLPNVVNVPVGAHFEDQKIPDNRLQDVLHGVHFVEATIPEISVPAITIPQGVDLEERIPDTLSADVFALPQMDILQTTQLKSPPSSNSVQDNVKIPKMCSSHMKSSCISSSFKNGRYITSRIKATKPKKLVASSESGHTEGVDVKLNEVKSSKLKRMVPGAERSRVEGVEEKLNEVLDSDGGISKRKDATKGYLKLLLVTAASGDNVKGEAFQSTRDLSIVLDALLKTKSRMVLVDIVNKNGLQMLHNIMKQNHRNFNKIPIIRKLLKVLEFLAVKEILTLEHINAPPPCAGVESFRDSIINLTRHKDMQVHHIARSFRDKWVPRTLRKVNLSDRDDVEFSHRSGHWKRFPASTLGHRQGPNEWHTNTINCATTTPIYTDSPTSQTSPSPLQLGSSDVSTTDGYPTTLTKQRKRKSRWDQPTEMDSGAESQPPQNTHRLIETNATLQGLNTSQVEPSLQKPKVYEVAQNQITAIQRDENYCTACDDNQSFRVAIQPLGASSQPSPNNHLSSNSPFLNPSNNNRRPYYPNPTCREVVMGQPQAKFLPNLPVSYGIPLPLVQRLGTFHQEDGGEGASCAGWAIAPAVPFHPFPPLPPCPPPSLQPCAHHITKPSERSLAEEVQGDNSTRNHHAESTMPTTSGAKPSEDMVFNRIRSPQSHERGRWSSGGLGRRFFRQQKWNFQGYPKCPPWVCQRNGWVSKGNWKHSGFSRVGNAMDEVGSMGQGKPSFRRTCGAGSCPSEDKGGKNGCNYYQHPPFDQQNHRKSYS